MLFPAVRDICFVLSPGDRWKSFGKDLFQEVE
jgi:hypothetical protein